MLSYIRQVTSDLLVQAKKEALTAPPGCQAHDVLTSTY